MGRATTCQQLQGGLHIMTPEILPFLRKVVETVASMINNDMKTEYGENLILVAEKQLQSDDGLKSSFQSCTSAVRTNFPQECFQNVYKELIHARVNEYVHGSIRRN